MITTAVLWARPLALTQRAAGMLTIERQLFTLARAGFTRVHVSAAKPKAALRLPEGLDVRWLPEEAQPPFVGISGDHFLRVETIQHIAQQEHAAPASYLDERGASVVQVLPRREDAMVKPAAVPLPAGSCSTQIMPWILSWGIKPADGFMAKHFDRHISLGISRALLDTFVTPNMITVVSVGIGLAGAWLFTLRTIPADVAGALLFWFHSVVDGVDGELARMRFQESKFGWTLDFWGDNLVHVALFSCLAYGWNSPAPGVMAVIGTLGAATLAYTQKLAGKGPLIGQSGPDALSKLETMLTQRDFVYILPVLAYLGYTYYFLWAAGIGSLLFFTLMLYLRSAKEVRTNEQVASTTR